jgi:hypothetical protein
MDLVPPIPRVLATTKSNHMVYGNVFSSNQVQEKISGSAVLFGFH